MFAGTKAAKFWSHDRIHTQALREERTRKDGDVNLHAQRLEGASGAGQSRRPQTACEAEKTDEPEQPRSGDTHTLYTGSARRGGDSGAGRPPDHAQHVRERAEKNTWVSTWVSTWRTSEKLVESAKTLPKPRHHNAKVV